MSNLQVPDAYASPAASGTSTPSGARLLAKDEVGYTKNVFGTKEKAEKAAQTEKLIRANGFIPTALIPTEVNWFYNGLNIDDAYFVHESADVVAQHVESLYGAKIQAHAANQDYLDIKLEKESDNHAVYIFTSPPGVASPDGPQYEARIDTQYFDDPTKFWRLESFRARSTDGTGTNATKPETLRCYFLSPSDCPTLTPAQQALYSSTKEEDISQLDIRKIASPAFLSKATENTVNVYEGIIKEVLKRMGPVVVAFEVQDDGEEAVAAEWRIVIGFRRQGTVGFFSALSDLYHAYGFWTSRKYVETFSNGVAIISLYLHPTPGVIRGPAGGAAVGTNIAQIIKDIGLIYVLPHNPLFESDGQFTTQEAAYAYSGWIFAQHFLNRLGPAYQSLREILNEDDPTHAAVLGEIKTRLRGETFTRHGILECLERYPEIVRLMYISFAMNHYYSANTPNKLMPTLSYARLTTQSVMSDEDLLVHIKKSVHDPYDAQILESFITFNKSILKTNFFTSTKVALSFRLDPSFLPETEYPVRAYGLFLVVGDEFRGFHLRMKDVARGGIRIVQSRNREAYSISQRNLFDEAFGLASTQALKNKDIPEGGSKGVILPDIGAKPLPVFQKYVDAIIDLLLPGQSPGIKEQIVDLYNKPEILFLGPDEGTADMMDWAAEHARARGAPWWKSFTTGKTASTLGGIPHDRYGMTSLSIKGYKQGIYRKLGLKEEEVTKVQTGGPDGDLGSNEILLSTDKTITIIDGSGVLHDPHGLNREEITRLAKARKMVVHFDKSKLSKDGYIVLVEDHDIRLPSGEVVIDGTDFRNSAHLRYKADILVPCGGRPASVNVNNVSKLWDSDGTPSFKYIVEGANLFITQPARLQLENKGIILFRDSSTNKGGVTSSSLEVLAGMALIDSEFLPLMTGEQASDFYLAYVRDIQTIIGANATAEFEALWAEHEKTGKAFSLLSQDLSQNLINLQSSLEESELYADENIRNKVLTKAFPPVMLKQVGIQELTKRLPEVYKQSLFASWISAHYLYSRGLNAGLVDFHFFLKALQSGQEF